eukprot:9170772-Karenia_brevis.AAC.1
MSPEIHSRVAKFNITWIPLRRRFFANSLIPYESKLTVMQSVMLAGILFQAGTWPILTSSEYSKLHTPIMRLYREICRDMYYEAWESDESLLLRCNLAAPMNLLRALRL